MYHTNLTRFLDENAAAYPERDAVLDGNSRLSFKELRGRALKLASAISQILEGKKRCVVAVFVPKGVDSITADVAIGYSGNKNQVAGVVESATRT